MTLAKAKAKTNETFTFIVQASLTIVTYDRKNMFIVQATGAVRWLFCFVKHLGLSPTSAVNTITQVRVMEA